MDEKFTLYEWCLKDMINITNLVDVDKYMTHKITEDEFNEFISKHDYEPSKITFKPEKYLELRMYGFVPYNISPIQQGIQFGHALQEYNNKYFTDGDFIKWREEFKTFIILNGGTSNSGESIRHGFKNVYYKGSMEAHLEFLLENGIKVGTFYEPDLNSMLSAIVFLVDERVFNKKIYPDFNYDVNTLVSFNYEEEYDIWVKSIGGSKNVELRKLLENKKLA